MMMVLTFLCVFLFALLLLSFISVFSGRAYLKEWSLTLYGTSVNPDRRKKKAVKPVNRFYGSSNSNKLKVPRPPPPDTSSPSVSHNFVPSSTVRRDPHPSSDHHHDLNRPSNTVDQILSSNKIDMEGYHPSERTEHG